MLTENGVASLKAGTDGATPILFVKHVFRTLATNSSPIEAVQNNSDRRETSAIVFEVILADRSAEVKCIVGRLSQLSAVKKGNVVKITAFRKLVVQGATTRNNAIVIEGVEPVTVELSAEDQVQVQAQSSLEILAKPVDGLRDYHLNLYGDLTSHSLEYILSLSQPLKSSLEPLLDENVPPSPNTSRATTQSTAKTAQPIAKNHPTLDALATNRTVKGKYVGRLKAMSKRVHFGRPGKVNKCPFTVQLIIGDSTRDLAISIWGSLALRADNDLQIGDIISIDNCRGLRTYKGQL